MKLESNRGKLAELLKVLPRPNKKNLGNLIQCPLLEVVSMLSTLQEKSAADVEILDSVRCLRSSASTIMHYAEYKLIQVANGDGALRAAVTSTPR